MAILIALLVAVSLWVAGFAHGYTVGVKETERRWSDAVNRKGYGGNW